MLPRRARQGPRALASGLTGLRRSAACGDAGFRASTRPTARGFRSPMPF